MPRTFVRDWSDGTTIHEALFAREVQIRTNRNGARYLQFVLDDRTGSIDGRYWNATDAEVRAVESGDYVEVKGKVQLFQGKFQIIISEFRRCDPANIDPGDFMPTSDKDPASQWAELREIMGRLADPGLQAIWQAFQMDERLMDAFRRVPAGVRNHHAYIGGLLDHVLTLLKLVDRIAPLYPQLDQDLLKMGVFLHDIGKTSELGCERGFVYTDLGQLVGHIIIGVEMLNEKTAVASELLGEPISAELIMRLKHLIASHHGSYEFGSPKLPMTTEAVALYLLDNLDAKICNFSQTIRDDINQDSNWTPYDPTLLRRLYKGARSSGGDGGVENGDDRTAD